MKLFIIFFISLFIISCDVHSDKSTIRTDVHLNVILSKQNNQNSWVYLINCDTGGFFYCRSNYPVSVFTDNWIYSKNTPSMNCIDTSFEKFIPVDLILQINCIKDQIKHSSISYSVTINRGKDTYDAAGVGNKNESKIEKDGNHKFF